MKFKRFLAVLGIILGTYMIWFGIGVKDTPPSSNSTYSTDTASFGGDFYSYEYKATRNAANNAAATAYNVRELGKAVSEYAGWAFIFAGSIVILKSLSEMVAPPCTRKRHRSKKNIRNEDDEIEENN